MKKTEKKTKQTNKNHSAFNSPKLLHTYRSKEIAMVYKDIIIYKVHYLILMQNVTKDVIGVGLLGQAAACAPPPKSNSSYLFDMITSKEIEYIRKFENTFK